MSQIVIILFTLMALSLANSEQRRADSEQIAGPASPADFSSWFKAALAWRANVTAHYNASIYDVPELRWTQTTFIQAQMHPYDLFFYDPISHQYTVDKYLEDVHTRYGGVDSLLIWPTCAYTVHTA